MTPGAPVGPSSASTTTGPDADTTSGCSPPIAAAPNTTSPPGCTLAMASGRPPPNGTTVTWTGAGPGSATASDRIAAPADNALPGEPGPTTNQE